MKFDYQLHMIERRIGSVDLKIEGLKDVNETIDQMFDMLQKRGSPGLLDELCPYFGIIWPSAEGLATYLDRMGAAGLKGKQVLEVGCGLAIPSMVACRHGAAVTATDSHPDVPAFLGRNLAHNPEIALTYLNADWSDGTELGTFDLVIASDCLYEASHPQRLAKFITRHMRAAGQIIVSDPGRPYLQDFVSEMRLCGFKDDLMTLPDVSQELKDIYILVFRSNS